MIKEKTAVEVFGQNFERGIILPIKRSKLSRKELFKHGDPFDISDKERDKLFEKGIIV